jgi:hypothetical protein
VICLIFLNSKIYLALGKLKSCLNGRRKPTINGKGNFHLSYNININFKEVSIWEVQDDLPAKFGCILPNTAMLNIPRAYFIQRKPPKYTFQNVQRHLGSSRFLRLSKNNQLCKERMNLSLEPPHCWNTYF